MQYTGVGFWIACFASGFLLLQHFAVRGPRSTHAAPGSGRAVMASLRHRVGGLLDGPRANQVIGTRLPLPVPLRARHRHHPGHRRSRPSATTANLFLSQRNLSNVARDVSETGILAVGMLLVIIIGGIDLSVGSVVALSATGVAFLLMRDQVPAYAAIGLILAMGLAIGWFNGWVSERFRVPSFVTTLAMLSMARGLAHHLVQPTSRCRSRTARAAPTRSSRPSAAHQRRHPGARHHHVHGRHRRWRSSCATHAVRALPLRHRRQPDGGAPVRRGGLAHQDHGLHAVRAASPR